MGEISTILGKISDYLLSITRNTDGGWYEITIGLPITWAFKDNDDISCEVLNETPTGRLILIKPKFIDVDVDDLINFILLIISTNQKISEKEEEFKRKIENIKTTLEEELKNHTTELEKLKENSFKQLDLVGVDNSNTPESEENGEKVKRTYKSRKIINSEKDE